MNNGTLRHPDGSSGGEATHPHDLGHASAELLERYLDGQLDERERRVFEKSLESDPTLREHLELQAKIDASLKRQTSPTPRFEAAHLIESPTPALNADVPAIPSAPAAHKRARSEARISWLRVAALVAIAMGGYFLYDTFVASRPVTFPMTNIRVTPAAAYANEVKNGMQPYQICTNSDEFAQYTKERLGAALAIEPVQGLTLIGWTYNNRVYSDKTVTMLASYNDQPIVILMDHAEEPAERSCDVSLDESTTTVAGVFLHEVRPKGVPSILAHFKPAP